MQEGNNIILFYGTPQNAETADHPEWITGLANYLYMIIKQVADQGPTITICNNSEAIKPIAKNAALITVLTKEALMSNAFIKELDEVCDIMAEQNSGATHNIFILLKHPVRTQILPEWVNTKTFINLFDTNPNTGRITEFNLGTEFTGENPRLWTKLVNLAYNIKNNASSEKISVKTKNASIFIAQTTPDQDENREIIKRELFLRGYNILPESNTAYNKISTLEKMLKKDISQSIISVHILGNHYGDYLPQSQYSLIDFQNKIAKQVQTEQDEKKLKRIIWIPEAFIPVDQRQQLYISRLQRNEIDDNTEIVHASIEQLKKVIIETANSIEQSNGNNVYKRSIYYISESNNELPQETKAIIDQQNIELLLAQNNKSIIAHYDRLQQADGVIIESSENELWMRSMFSDVIKAKGYGKKNDFKLLIVIGDKTIKSDNTIFDNYFEFIGNNNINEELPKKLSSL